MNSLRSILHKYPSNAGYVDVFKLLRIIKKINLNYLIIILRPINELEKAALRAKGKNILVNRAIINIIDKKKFNKEDNFKS